MSDQQELPYSGSSGWSGSDTSRARAEREDGDGTTSKRQSKTLLTLGDQREQGATWRELAYMHAWHHGQASGVLSVLHKVGRVARLKETRDRCAVYVLPEFVEGRPTAAHGVKRKALTEREEKILGVLKTEALIEQERVSIAVSVLGEIATLIDRLRS